MFSMIRFLFLFILFVLRLKSNFLSSVIVGCMNRNRLFFKRTKRASAVVGHEKRKCIESFPFMLISIWLASTVQNDERLFVNVLVRFIYLISKIIRNFTLLNRIYEYSLFLWVILSIFISLLWEFTNGFDMARRAFGNYYRPSFAVCRGQMLE